MLGGFDHQLDHHRPDYRLFADILSAQKRVHSRCGIGHHSPLDVTIGVRGQGDGAMAQDLHHEAQRQTLRYKERRSRVSKVVQAHIGQLRRRERGFELGLDIFWFNRPAEWSSEHQATQGVTPTRTGR